MAKLFFFLQQRNFAVYPVLHHEFHIRFCHTGPVPDPYLDFKQIKDWLYEGKIRFGCGKSSAFFHVKKNELVEVAHLIRFIENMFKGNTSGKF